MCCERLRLIEQYESDARCRFIVLDSPLLLEAGLDRDCEAIVFVDSSDEVRKSRVQRTRGWQSSEWIAREKSQITLDKKRKKADYVVANNSSDLNELRLATGNLLESLKKYRHNQRIVVTGTLILLVAFKDPTELSLMLGTIS